MLRALDAECNLTIQICPRCGRRGDFAAHGSYKRNLVKLILEIPVDTRITVKRVICRSCLVTHAVIPADVVPYRQYSVTFCAYLFELRLSGKRTIEDICRSLDISPTTYYRIYRKSLGKIVVVAGALSRRDAIERFLKDVTQLIRKHLLIHRIKPFESGRLYPAFSDP